MSSTLLLPHAHSFVKGPAVINTHTSQSKGCGFTLCPVRLFSERAKSKRFMSRRPVIPRDCGLWSHGNRCCIGTTRTKRRCIGTKCTKLVASSPRSFRWSPKYMGSPHGLQSTWAHHDGLQNAKIVHMGRNVPKRWAQGDLSGTRCTCKCCDSIVCVLVLDSILLV